MMKLKFTLSNSTPSLQTHPITSLQTHTPSSHGWQSPPHTTYPVEIVMKFEGGPKRLGQLQILSHQCKIAGRVDVVVGYDSLDSSDRCASSFEACRHHKKLGYISLDANVRSNYRARELKSVYLDTKYNVSYVKLVVHEPWKNEFNVLGQVGIIAVNCLGTCDYGNYGSDGGGGGGDVKFPSIVNSSNHKHGRNDEGSTSTSNGMRQSQSIDNKVISFASSNVTNRIRSLQNQQQTLASNENYDAAHTLKTTLKTLISKVHTLEIIERDMKTASDNEDYARAGSFKKDKDKVKGDVEVGLGELEGVYLNLNGGMDRISVNTDRNRVSSAKLRSPSKSSNNGSSSGSSSPSKLMVSNNIVTRDVFRSTPHANNNNNDDYSNDDSGGGKGDTSVSYYDDNSGYESDDANMSDASSSHTNTINNANYTSANNTNNTSLSIIDEEDSYPLGQHPLEGVPLLTADSSVNDLPVPSKLNQTSDIGTYTQLEQLTKIIGSYRVRCFLSSNWQLRDAVLYKISMLLPDIVSTHGFAAASTALCGMVGKSVEDRVTKVFLTSLIVLDDILHEMEKVNLPHKQSIPLLEPIMLCLLTKLSDRTKPSVVEGAFNMLFNFALSSCVGHAYIGLHALKRMAVKEGKNPKHVCARFELLVKLLSEFGEEAVDAGKVMDFICSTSIGGFKHKDDKVRLRSKELTMACYVFLGASILPWLNDNLSVRVLREYRLGFDELTVNDGVVKMTSVKDEEEVLRREEEEKAREDKEIRMRQIYASQVRKENALTDNSGSGGKDGLSAAKGKEAKNHQDSPDKASSMAATKLNPSSSEKGSGSPRGGYLNSSGRGRGRVAPNVKGSVSSPTSAKVGAGSGSGSARVNNVESKEVEEKEKDDSGDGDGEEEDEEEEGDDTDDDKEGDDVEGGDEDDDEEDAGGEDEDNDESKEDEEEDDNDDDNGNQDEVEQADKEEEEQEEVKDSS